MDTIHVKSHTIAILGVLDTYKVRQLIRASIFNDNGMLLFVAMSCFVVHACHMRWCHLRHRKSAEHGLTVTMLHIRTGCLHATSDRMHIYVVVCVAEFIHRSRCHVCVAGRSTRQSQSARPAARQASALRSERRRSMCVWLLMRGARCGGAKAPARRRGRDMSVSTQHI